MAKQSITISLEDDLIGRLDGLAATMGASRSWTIAKLLDAALDPGGLHPAAGAAGSPPPGFGPEAAGRGNHTGESM